MADLERKKTGKDIAEQPIETQERIIFDTFINNLSKTIGIEPLIDRPIVRTRGSVRKPRPKKNKKIKHLSF